VADNIAITPGSGAIVAADDIGGVLYQRVKLDVGADGASVAASGDAGNGLDVDVTRVSGNVTVIQGTATSLKVDASEVAVPVTDNASSLTVDAPVATPVFVRLSDGAAPITTLPVSLTSTTANQGTAAAVASAWPAKISDGTNTVGITDVSGAKALKVDVIQTVTETPQVDKRRSPRG
jgi:hypothetical protein